MKNNLKVWEENREWLQSSGYMEDLKEVVSELHVLKYAVQGLETPADYERDGMVSLIGTVASKLDDMAHGRLKHMLLPE